MDVAVQTEPVVTADERPVIVFILAPERSAFNASFTLARRLLERGYRILYTGPESWREHVQAQGFEYEVFQYVRHPDEPVEEEGKTPEPLDFSGFRGWLRLREYVRFYRWAGYELEGRGVRALKQYKPLLALVDPLAWPFAYIPLKCSVPIITFNTNLSSFFNWHVPPTFCDLLPGDKPGMREYVRNGWAWGKLLLSRRLVIDYYKWLMALKLMMWPDNRTQKAIVRLGGKIRYSEYGLRLVFPELVSGPRAFELPQMLESNKRTYIGSCVDVLRKDVDFDWGHINPKHKLVYCSLGTYSHNYKWAKKLFASVVEAIKQREDLQAIIQIGTAADMADFQDVPQRICIVKQAPQLVILEQTDIFITHGGLGSTRESIYFGVPMIVFPGWFEQPGNGARVVYHDLGVMGDMEMVTTDKVLSLIEDIESHDRSANLSRMKKAFEAEASCQAGVDFIEDFLHSKGHSAGARSSELTPSVREEVKVLT